MEAIDLELSKKNQSKEQKISNNFYIKNTMKERTGKTTITLKMTQLRCCFYEHKSDQPL